MPTIRISDANWARMKVHAQPLEDSADDVIGRALDALEKEVRKNAPKPLPAAEVEKLKEHEEALRKQAEDKLPQRAFRMPLLQVLFELGGSAAVKDVRKAMLPKMEGRLSPGDHVKVSSGDPRWWNAVCWERNELVKMGILRDDSERGIWALNEGAQISLHKKSYTDGDKLEAAGTLPEMLQRYCATHPHNRERRYFFMMDDTVL